MAVPGAAAPVGLDGNGLNGPGNIFRDAAQHGIGAIECPRGP